MKHPIHQIVDKFLELKGWDKKPKEFYITHPYGRYVRVAKRLLRKCRGDVELAKSKLWDMKHWAKENNCDWAIETIMKRWDEDSGPKEQEIKTLEIADKQRSDISEEQQKENIIKLNKMKAGAFGKL